MVHSPPPPAPRPVSAPEVVMEAREAREEEPRGGHGGSQGGYGGGAIASHGSSQGGYGKNNGCPLVPI